MRETGDWSVRLFNQRVLTQAQGKTLDPGVKGTLSRGETEWKEVVVEGVSRK